MGKTIQPTTVAKALAIALAAALVGGAISCKALDGWWAYQQLGWLLSKSAKSGPARMDVFGRVPVVHVYGTPRQMGEQYGTLLREPLRALRRCLHAFVDNRAMGKLLDYARRNEQYLPDSIREELKAVAEATGMPYVELVAMNVVPKLACSALAVWRDDDANDPGLVMGRNAEYFSLGFKDRGMLVVVYHPDKGQAVATVNFLGMIGAFTGINDRGVAFGNMLVFNAAGPPASKGGLTIQLALRVAAQRAQTAAQMAELLRQGQHVIPMNVMVADRGEALVLALAPGRTDVRRGDRGVLAATNYFRRSPMRTANVRCNRYDSLIAAGVERRGRMDAGQMIAALHAARIDELNLQAVVFEPGPMRMHVSINRIPASAGPYLTFDLRKLFETTGIAGTPPVGYNSR